jgi:hypothetical protein
VKPSVTAAASAIAAAAVAARPQRGAPAKPYSQRLANAAAHLGHKASWLRAYLTSDRKRIAAGLPPLGPPWFCGRGGTIYYITEQLEAWFHANAVEFGTCANRKK